MTDIINFFISIMASVAGHYISKWLDRNSKDSQPKKNPQDWPPGGSLCANMNHHKLLGYNHNMLYLRKCQENCISEFSLRLRAAKPAFFPLSALIDSGQTLHRLFKKVVQ